MSKMVTNSEPSGKPAGLIALLCALTKQNENSISCQWLPTSPKNALVLQHKNNAHCWILCFVYTYTLLLRDDFLQISPKKYSLRRRRATLDCATAPDTVAKEFMNFVSLNYAFLFNHTQYKNNSNPGIQSGTQNVLTDQNKSYRSITFICTESIIT